MKKSTQYKGILYALAFILIAILLRFLSFSYSVIDHDESTYMVIAQEILKGKIFYIDVWDTKPMGIFLIYAGVIKAFGHSVFMIRLFTAIVIGLTAYLISLASDKWGNTKQGGVFAAILYIIMCSVHQWNFAANSEIFFNFFTALSLLIFLGASKPIHFLMLGLTIGCGFLIKYFVLFDLLAFGLFYLICAIRIPSKRKLRLILSNTIAMGSGALIPFALMFFFFDYKGLTEEFWFATIQLPGNYISHFDWSRASNFFLEFHLVYFPMLLLAYALLWRGPDRKLALLGGIWMALIWVIILLPAKFFLHYYFQLLVPLAFILGGFLKSGIWLERKILSYKKVMLPIVLLAFLAWNVTLQYKRFIKHPDPQKEIAIYLESIVQEEDELYCNSSNFVYFYLDKSPPHKYVHPTLTSKKEHIEAARIDVDAVMQNVVGRKMDWMVIQGKPHHLIRQQLESDYSLAKDFGDYKVYRINSSI